MLRIGNEVILAVFSVIPNRKRRHSFIWSSPLDFMKKISYLLRSEEI